MICLEKSDLFELYNIYEEDLFTGGTIFSIEYGTGLELNLLFLEKLIKEWGYEIKEKRDWEIDPKDTYNNFDIILAVYTDFPYSKFIIYRDDYFDNR